MPQRLQPSSLVVAYYCYFSYVSLHTLFPRFLSLSFSSHLPNKGTKLKKKIHSNFISNSLQGHESEQESRDLSLVVQWSVYTSDVLKEHLYLLLTHLMWRSCCLNVVKSRGETFGCLNRTNQDQVGWGCIRSRVNKARTLPFSFFTSKTKDTNFSRCFCRCSNHQISPSLSPRCRSSWLTFISLNSWTSSRGLFLAWLVSGTRLSVLIKNHRRHTQVWRWSCSMPPECRLHCSHLQEWTE